MQEFIKKGEFSEQELKDQLQQSIVEWQDAFKKSAEATIRLGNTLYNVKRYCEQQNLPYLKTVQSWSGLPASTISSYTLIGEKAELLMKKVEQLPPSAGALYALARLPEQVIEEAKVTPEMAVKDIKKLDPEINKKDEEKKQEVKSTKVSNEITKIISSLKTIRDNWITLEDELSAKKIKKLKASLKKTLEILEEDEDDEKEAQDETFEV